MISLWEIFSQLIRLIGAGLFHILTLPFATSEPQQEPNPSNSDSSIVSSINSDPFVNSVLQELLFASDASIASKIGGGDGESEPAYSTATESFQDHDEPLKTPQAKASAHSLCELPNTLSEAPNDRIIKRESKLEISSLNRHGLRSDSRKSSSTRKSRCRINLSNCDSSYVHLAARRFGMTNSIVNWDVRWTTSFVHIQQCKLMKRHQRINHFPGSFHVSLKDHLARNLNWLQKHFPDVNNFFPKTWDFPEDARKLFVYRRKHPKAFFIFKPNNGSCGRGIVLTRDLTRLPSNNKMIIQHYIDKPFLIDGFKFDFRIYVLVSSLDPLKIFVYNEGFARFATVKYKSPTDYNSSNDFMHLTNTSVNIHSKSYTRDEFIGNYRTLSSVFETIMHKGYNVEDIRNAIDDTVIKTLLSCLPTLKCYYSAAFPSDTTSACFELFGFDIILDHNLKAYLLEVNSSPSLNTGTGMQYESQVKESVVFDTFNILNLSKRSRHVKNDVVERRLIDWENSHMGNFRRVYPPSNRLAAAYYQKFIDKGVRNPHIRVYP